MSRVVILVLDSFGIGYSEDAHNFGDEGANTLAHIAAYCQEHRKNEDGSVKALALPNLASLGLIKAAEEAGNIKLPMKDSDKLIGSYAYAAEESSGKDTPSGHWEIAGVPVLFDWGYFSDKENSFPEELLENIVKKAGLKGYLGNCHASGTVILDQLGEEHMKSGKPIFYTSADSVFQIAAHEETFGLEKLYELCEIVREELNDEKYNFGKIGRVIARPFIGKKAGEFSRTGNRHDYAIKPPQPTVLEKLVEEKKGEVISIGKIADIFANAGITKKRKATGTEELFNATLEEVKEAPENSIIFTNFVNFDSDFGHRRNILGYAQELEYFDKRLPELYPLLKDDDILIITADHGCDPTWQGTEHTREYIPVLIYSKTLEPQNFGKRTSFADIGQTIAKHLDLSAMDFGELIFSCERK